ncbi:hypothetical protein [Rothia mucilaginosa]|uniref:hypothetical protein n=1 Tax=Rothia mucilaginosa TaxID=43675 RepID=UPI00288AC0FE|nr:hypothetical protein [Rothia mucilaginosa]
MNFDDDLRVGKFYTRGLKIPTLVGRLTDGTRIWGGPYTIPQLVVGVIALMILWQVVSRFLSTGFIITDAALILAGAWGITIAVGKIPETRRNLFYMSASSASAVSAPKNGTFRGAPFKIRQPRLYRPFKTEEESIKVFEQAQQARLRACQQFLASQGAEPQPVTQKNPAPSTTTANRRSTLENIIAARPKN